MKLFDVPQKIQQYVITLIDKYEKQGQKLSIRT